MKNFDNLLLNLLFHAAEQAGFLVGVHEGVSGSSQRTKANAGVTVPGGRVMARAPRSSRGRSRVSASSGAAERLPREAQKAMGHHPTPDRSKTHAPETHVKETATLYRNRPTLPW